MDDFLDRLESTNDVHPQSYITRSCSFEGGLAEFFGGHETAGNILEDGYFLVKGVYDAKCVEKLRCEGFTELSKAQHEEAAWLAREPDGNTSRVLFDIDKLAPAFNQLIRGEIAQGVATHLLGSDHYTYQTRINWKFRDTGEEFAWHSDFETWACLDGIQQMQLFTFCVFLSENTVETGCVEAIPGSQRILIPSKRWSRVNRAETDDYSYSEGSHSRQLISEKFSHLPIVQLTGSAGDVLVLDCNILHRSGRNTQNSDRANFYVVFNRSDNKPDLSKLSISPRASYHCRVPIDEA